MFVGSVIAKLAGFSANGIVANFSHLRLGSRRFGWIENEGLCGVKDLERYCLVMVVSGSVDSFRSQPLLYYWMLLIAWIWNPLHYWVLLVPSREYLSLVRQFPDRFKIHSLSCRRSIEILIDQIKEFAPKQVVVKASDQVNQLRELFTESELNSLWRPRKLRLVQHPDVNLWSQELLEVLSPCLKAWNPKRSGIWK